LLAFLARAAYSYVEDFRLAGELRAQIASAFEHPACERLTRLPVTELPETSELGASEAPCLWVVYERRRAHRMNRSTQITAADVRAWPLPVWPSWSRFRDRDAFLLALVILAALYGIGLLTEFAATRRRRRMTSSPRTDRHL
jgi:hypothetical protein